MNDHAIEKGSLPTVQVRSPLVPSTAPPVHSKALTHAPRSPPSHLPPPPQSASKLFRTLCYNNKDKLLAGIIVAGWDPVEGGQVYEVPLGGSCVRLPFAVGGSGSTYIYGFVDSAYRPGMSREECVTFVRAALSHAMARDGSSGGVIRTVTIDKEGVTRDFVAGDKLPYMLATGHRQAA